MAACQVAMDLVKTPPGRGLLAQGRRRGHLVLGRGSARAGLRRIIYLGGSG